MQSRPDQGPVGDSEASHGPPTAHSRDQILLSKSLKRNQTLLICRDMDAGPWICHLPGVAGRVRWLSPSAAVIAVDLKRHSAAAWNPELGGDPRRGTSRRPDDLRSVRRQRAPRSQSGPSGGCAGCEPGRTPRVYEGTMKRTQVQRLVRQAAQFGVTEPGSVSIWIASGRLRS
jgi:hypothetical protein